MRRSHKIQSFPVTSRSVAKETIGNPQSHGYNANLASSGAKAKEEDYLRSSVKEERVAALSSKSAASSLAKKIVDKREKSKPKKKPPPASKKKTSQKKPAKSTKAKPKRTSSPSVSPAKLSKNEKIDASEECVEEAEEEAVDEKERQKRNKSIIVKAIPRADGAKEFQISTNKLASAKKPAAATLSGANKSRVQGEKAGLSIGDVKDLLGKLIVKVILYAFPLIFQVDCYT